MKLRMQGNSVRLRISRSELGRFVENGRLEETTYFGPGPDSKLSYILASVSDRRLLDVTASPGRIQVLVPAALVRDWSRSEQVGIAGEVDLGVHGTLLVLIEKDFACVGRSADENADTFPNPLAEHSASTTAQC